jgi:hypothetical protein
MCSKKLEQWNLAGIPVMGGGRQGPLFEACPFYYNCRAKSQPTDFAGHVKVRKEMFDVVQDKIVEGKSRRR